MKYIKYVAAIVFISAIFISCGDKKHRRKKAEEVSQLEYYIEQAGKQDTNFNHAFKTQTEMYYIYTDTGKGEIPLSGDVVSIRYECYYLDSILITDNYLSPQPLRFQLWTGVSSGSFPVDIQGFHEGIALMRNGGRAKFLVPSTLAYGGNGKYGIPGYTTLRFEVEMTDLVSSSGQ